MMEETSIEAENPMASVPEVAGNRLLDPMIRDWPTIASLAWEGFVMSGRGHVLVSVEEDGVSFEYAAGAPCPFHADEIEDYDPELEVVVAVSLGQAVDVYRFASFPTPPEVWATTPGSIYGADEH